MCPFPSWKKQAVRNPWSRAGDIHLKKEFQTMFRQCSDTLKMFQNKFQVVWGDYIKLTPSSGHGANQWLRNSTSHSFINLVTNLFSVDCLYPCGQSFWLQGSSDQQIHCPILKTQRMKMKTSYFLIYAVLQALPRVHWIQGVTSLDELIIAMWRPFKLILLHRANDAITCKCVQLLWG